MNESVADSVLSTLAADAVLRTTRNLLQKMKIALDRVAIQLQNFPLKILLKTARKQVPFSKL